MIDDPGRMMGHPEGGLMALQPYGINTQESQSKLSLNEAGNAIETGNSMFHKNLKHWRVYQENKRKIKRVEMAANNRFPCTISSVCGSFPGPADLIVEEEENRILIVSQINNRNFVKFDRSEIRGRSIHEATIIITVNEALGEAPMILEFLNQEVLLAALAALETFGEENVDLPSSGESDSN